MERSGRPSVRSRSNLPDDGAVTAAVKKLLSEQTLAALATSGRDGAYVNLVVFTASEDLREIVFSTPRATRKFANLSTDARAALLIDSRSHRTSGFRRPSAVTALGRARELQGPAREKYRSLYLSRHPRLASFVDAPSSALIGLRVSRYILVRDFQRVDTIEFDR